MALTLNFELEKETKEFKVEYQKPSHTQLEDLEKQALKDNLDPMFYLLEAQTKKSEELVKFIKENRYPVHLIVQHLDYEYDQQIEKSS